MTTRYQATPRSRAWAPEREYTWRRDWLKGLLVLAAFICAGINDIRW